MKPSYLMWLAWADGRISFIRDYRYVRYVIDDAELVLAPDAAPPGEGTAHASWRSTGKRRRQRSSASRRSLAERKKSAKSIC